MIQTTETIYYPIRLLDMWAYSQKKHQFVLLLIYLQAKCIK